MIICTRKVLTQKNLGAFYQVTAFENGNTKCNKLCSNTKLIV